MGINNTDGGLAKSVTWMTFLDCVAINNTCGALYTGSGKFFGGTFANNSLGGVMYTSFGSINGVTVTNQSAPTLVDRPTGDVVIADTNGFTAEQACTRVSNRLTEWDIVVYNGANHLASYGTAALTNWSDAQIWAHRPTAVASHVPYYLDVAVKPSSVRSVEIGAWGRSDCYYSYAVTPAGTKPLGGTTPIATTAGQWNYVSAQLTNTLPVPQSFRLWVSMTNAVAPTEGWTRVNLPTDYTVRVQ